MLTIALYNLKGGVGKTTSAVNLAHLASQAGKSTVLWDWDPQAAASWYFGVDKGKKKAIKVFSKGVPLGKLELSTPYPKLTVIPADLSLRSADIELAGQGGARKMLRKLIQPLSESASILIFDCPPTISPSVEYLLSAVDIVLVPVIPNPLSIRAIDQVNDFFEDKSKDKSPAKVYGFFNMVDTRRALHRDTLDSADYLSLPMLKTVIPMDSAAEKMAQRRAPLTSYANRGRAADAYRKLWREIVKAAKG